MKVELEWHHRSKIVDLVREEIKGIERGQIFYGNNEDELATLREILTLVED